MAVVRGLHSKTRVSQWPEHKTTMKIKPIGYSYAYRSRWRSILSPLLRLQLSIDLGRRGSYIPLVSQIPTSTQHQGAAVLPAAAAGSADPDFLAESVAGLPGSRLNGLRVRVSDRRDGGDRERRSNRDGRRGSGSVWSKRERLGRRSSSAMASFYPSDVLF